MKICIHCFGPIYHYEFDLDKDFHLIVGENSVGKSYAITLVYLIIKGFLSVESHNLISFFFDGAVKADSLLEGLNERLSQVGERKSVDVKRFVEAGLRNLLIGSFLSRLQASVDGTFDSDSVLKNQHADEDFQVVIEAQACSITLSLEDKRLSISRVSVNSQYLVRVVRTNRSPTTTRAGRTIYHNLDSPDFIKFNFADEIIGLLSEVADEVFERCATIHYLPASRSGLYQALSAFGQIVAELSKSRAFITRRIDLPNISEPLSDYFLKLSNITVQTRRFADSKLDDIASGIEDDILGGKVEFDSKTKRIMFRPGKTTLRLDLSVTSSMVSELSPIVTYLRYILTEPTRRSVASRKRETILQSLIIIEEPEAHLHPKVQVKLVEQFAALTKLGVKVVITSHSNFVFNKASNLVIAGKLSPAKVAATLFRMETHGSVGKRLAIDAYGIDDENFVDTSESLFIEKSDLVASHA
jgi:hypothetical protein